MKTRTNPPNPLRLSKGTKGSLDQGLFGTSRYRAAQHAAAKHPSVHATPFRAGWTIPVEIGTFLGI